MSDLEFKPITEGLGFHPFADGLPYAPGSKTTTSHQATPTKTKTEHRAPVSGVGATAASIARPMRLPQPAVATRAVTAGPAASPAAFLTPQQAQQVAAATQVAHELNPALQPYGFVYMFERVAAYSLDSALILAGLAAGTSFYLANFAIPSTREMTTQDLAYVMLVVGSLHWALMTFQEVAFGATLGKRIFGLRLPGSAAGVFLRSFFFLPSLGFACLGLVSALFDSRRRCLHDLITDIQPVRWN